MSGILDTIDGGLYVYSGRYYKLIPVTDAERKAAAERIETERATQTLPIPPNQRSHVFSEDEVREAKPTPAFSRRTQMTPVRDQGNHRGTCTVFGILAQHEFNWNHVRDFSEQYLYWGAKDEDNDSEKTSIDQAWSVLEYRGVCREVLSSYTTAQPFPKWGGPDPGPAAHFDAWFYRAYKHWWIDNDDIDRLKRCIYELGYVVTIGVPVWWNCWSSNGNIRMPTREDIEHTREVLDSLPSRSGAIIDGHHTICLCGYNDRTARFEFKNSWDDSWGASGYGSIPYDYIGEYGFDALIFQSFS